MNKFLPQYSPKGPAGKFTTILVYIPNSIREEEKTPYYSDHQICLNQFWGQGRLKLLLQNVSGVWVTYFLQNYNTALIGPPWTCVFIPKTEMQIG